MAASEKKRLPDWLYEKRPGVHRWGAAKTLHVCVMRMDLDPGYMAPCWLGNIWRFNWMFGPPGGVEAGIYERTSRVRIFYRRRPGRVFAIAWESTNQEDGGRHGG